MDAHTTVTGTHDGPLSRGGAAIYLSAVTVAVELDSDDEAAAELLGQGV
jgi:hypothetical protein